jgi:hypothetical protein
MPQFSIGRLFSNRTLLVAMIGLISGCAQSLMPAPKIDWESFDEVQITERIRENGVGVQRQYTFTGSEAKEIAHFLASREQEPWSLGVVGEYVMVFHSPGDEVLHVKTDANLRSWWSDRDESSRPIDPKLRERILELLKQQRSTTQASMNDSQ